MLLSGLCFATLNVCIRYVDHLNTFQLVFFRTGGSLICCLFLMTKLNIKYRGHNQKLLWARAITGFSSLALFYKAIQLMPIGTAVSLRYLSPAFATLLAIYFLKEKVSWKQWICFAVAFVGVVILKGFDPRISTTALVIIMICAFISGCVYVIITKMGKTEHPIRVVFYFMLLSTAISLPLSLTSWVSPHGLQWLALAFMGIIGFYAQLFMTKALQGSEANIVTPFKYSEAIFTLIFAWLIYSESQGLIQVLAIILIITALIANIYFKQKQKSV